MRERGNERFADLHLAQQELEKKGYYFHPVEKELTEGAITEPLVARIRQQIKRRGFARMAGHTIITFSGYEGDPREVDQVPEIRSYFRKLAAIRSSETGLTARGWKAGKEGT